MIEDEQLVAYQEAVIEAALRGDKQVSLQELLLADPSLCQQHDWIRSWEPRMGDLARVLTLKWAVEEAR